MQTIKRFSMSRESYLLLIIGVTDLLVTLWLVNMQRAVEGNPIMSFYLNKGWLAFAMVKMTLLALPIFIAEWCRRYNPRFVQRMLRVAIVAYIGMYSLAFTQLHSTNTPHMTPPPIQIQHVMRGVSASNPLPVSYINTQRLVSQVGP